MGIPYSKQINSAFDQVTPLVAAGFRVLETTKNISILLAAIQVLTCVFLALIFLALLALLITMSPDMEHERQAIVTPAMKWLASWVMDSGWWFKIAVWTIAIGSVTGGGLGLYVTQKTRWLDPSAPPTPVEEPAEDDAAVQT